MRERMGILASYWSGNQDQYRLDHLMFFCGSACIVQGTLYSVQVYFKLSFYRNSLLQDPIIVIYFKRKKNFTTKKV